MSIKLERPIAFLDIESTGTNKDTDRIVELSICKLLPNMSREVATWKVNPGMLIPEASTAIHGITNDDVKNCLQFFAIAKDVIAFIDGCDVGGFNSNHFDIPMLFNEFTRAGISWDYKKVRMVDAGNIFKICEPRTLVAAAKFYLQVDHVGAHGAEADACMTVDVFLAQMGRYPEIPKQLDELHLYCNHGKPLLDLSGKFTYNEKGDIIFNFGPKRGERALNHPDFLDWMCNKASFSIDTYNVARGLLDQYHNTQYAD